MAFDWVTIRAEMIKVYGRACPDFCVKPSLSFASENDRSGRGPATELKGSSSAEADLRPPAKIGRLCANYQPLGS